MAAPTSGMFVRKSPLSCDLFQGRSRRGANWPPVDGIEDTYVRRAFLQQRYGTRAADLEPWMRDLCAAEGFDVEEIWIRLEHPPEGDGTVSELCPMCLIAVIPLRRLVDDAARALYIGHHVDCGTTVWSPARSR